MFETISLLTVERALTWNSEMFASLGTVNCEPLVVTLINWSELSSDESSNFTPVWFVEPEPELNDKYFEISVVWPLITGMICWLKEILKVWI